MSAENNFDWLRSKIALTMDSKYED